MDLAYFQDCPSCGAPIELTEADRLIICPFCEVANYMVKEGPLRFVLPDKLPVNISAHDLIYIPYLRFKGHIYSCQGKEVEYKIIDTTQIGVGDEKLPASLGLRPQAMSLNLGSVNRPGKFVNLTEELTSIFSKAAKLTSAFIDKKKGPLYHRSFIGETLSIIYLPTYAQEGEIYDAVLNRKLSETPIIDNLNKSSFPFKRKWQPRFISTFCPHCAEIMSGTRDSLVLTCRNCNSSWQEKGGKFVRVDWSVVPAQKGDGLFLPFWKISNDANGVTLRTYGDFLRITNQPVVIRESHDDMELCFWVPAFKVSPKYFLHIAKNLTVSQIRLPAGKKELTKNIYQVTLPLSEAIQALKTILGYSVMNKRRFLPQMKSVSFITKTSQLVYLPFNDVGHDLVQDHTSVTISRTIMHHGRTM